MRYRKAPPEVAANTMLCLIRQTSYRLDQQLRQRERTFVEEGGFTERLYNCAIRQKRSGKPNKAYVSRP